jgi:hypothetical protein
MISFLLSQEKLQEVGRDRLPASKELSLPGQRKQAARMLGLERFGSKVVVPLLLPLGIASEKAHVALGWIVA